MCVTLGNPSSAHSRCALRDAESIEDGDGKACLLCIEATMKLSCLSGGGTDGVVVMAHQCFLFQRQYLLRGPGEEDLAPLAAK